MSSNRLREQTSPYLLQHADNPVHWQPWDEQALQQAVAENKPVLLSVGYSACHWCHVMAHESFADPATAKVMNEHFINIKIDREERPDLDQIYQFAHQMLTQRGGGWPLTMFLTPGEHIPFFGGTYFPPIASHGLPAFKDLLVRVADFYTNNQTEIAEQSSAIGQVFRDSVPQPGHPDTELGPVPVQAARQQLVAAFDAQWGGFGGAPKFPQPTGVQRMLRTWRNSAFNADPDIQALHVATHSLVQMARGGLFDHVGGGFYRYSVDHKWRIPHFEKMLYDNAQLLPLYAQAWRATGEALFERVANTTADWMLREMRHANQGFYTALDADSEGHEGLFYVWDKAQVKAVLSATQYRVIELRYGLNEAPNFESKYHFYLAQTVTQISEQTQFDRQQVNDLLTESLAALFAAREKRERPFCDTKQLTASNALAIRALAISSGHLKRPDLLNAAESTLTFIQQQLWHDNALKVSYSHGQAHLNAYLNDYAYLLDATLELLQVRWRQTDLQFCVQLADALLENFYDVQDGGFFFTGNDHEVLLHRMKPLTDDATPSGNAIAAQALNKLGHLLGEQRYLHAAEKTLQLAWTAMESLPHGHCSMIDTLEDYLHPVQCVIIRAPEEQLAQWMEIATATYAPMRMCFGIPDDAKGLPGALALRKPQLDGVAYICQGHQCGLPVTSKAALAAGLKKLN